MTHQEFIFMKVSSSGLVPAKNGLMYTWTIPFGCGLDVSKDISFESGIEYYHVRRSPVFTEKKYSEDAMFQMIIRYKL